MKTDLTDTTASKINKGLVQARRAIGTPAVGMVLTLVIVTDEENAYDALKAADDASHEHPSRTLVVIRRVSRSPRDRTRSRLDAEVRVGADAGTGETVVLRLYGEASDHAQSVVLPLLLPDAPVVVWWPVGAPRDPAKDPLGALGQRRVTDSYSAQKPIDELRARADSYEPGDTDLAWARITPWRSVLAAALDQVRCEVISAEVTGEDCNPSVELLAMWLADRLHVHVRRGVSAGPGLTEVRLVTTGGPIAIHRPDGAMATLALRGQPDRAVALKRRETSELIAEELRRLDPDDTYASALRFGVDRLGGSEPAGVKVPAPASGQVSVTPRAVPNPAAGPGPSPDPATPRSRPAEGGPSAAPPSGFGRPSVPGLPPAPSPSDRGDGGRPSPARMPAVKKAAPQ
jgi:glucose-6-phosphate dehydrogenase assembly protein OpcA